jgi:hypothetical protein
MSSDDPHYTFNPLGNEDKELLLRNGYKPGELAPGEERELLEDLKGDSDDPDGTRLRGDVPADEWDNT